jgi:hypothetical protein
MTGEEGMKKRPYLISALAVTFISLLVLAGTEADLFILPLSSSS